jgi:hypothetical protein
VEDEKIRGWRSLEEMQYEGFELDLELVLPYFPAFFFLIFFLFTHFSPCLTFLKTLIEHSHSEFSL